MPSQKGSSKPLPPDKGKKVFDVCPHCGAELSPWEKVLLGVDRALMCKHCWYRIILDVFEEKEGEEGEDKPQSKDENQ